MGVCDLRFVIILLLDCCLSLALAPSVTTTVSPNGHKTNVTSTSTTEAYSEIFEEDPHCINLAGPSSDTVFPDQTISIPCRCKKTRPQQPFQKCPEWTIVRGQEYLENSIVDLYDILENGQYCETTRTLSIKSSLNAGRVKVLLQCSSQALIPKTVYYELIIDSPGNVKSDYIEPETALRDPHRSFIIYPILSSICFLLLLLALFGIYFRSNSRKNRAQSRRNTTHPATVWNAPVIQEGPPSYNEAMTRAQAAQSPSSTSPVTFLTVRDRVENEKKPDTCELQIPEKTQPSAEVKI